MQLYPAIDMKDGNCVRLKQGQFQDITVYSKHPAEVAGRFQAEGATFLHLVDLDGALQGHSVNKSVIREIAATVGLPIQVGGGIRSKQGVEDMLNLGVNRVIIGTKAVERPDFMRELVEEFGASAIVAGVDAKDGLVAVEGWEKVSAMSALNLCLLMKEYGIRHVVYTDISKDGMLKGPNIADTKKLTEETGMDIIASGGVSSMEDLQSLSEAGIQGAIIGKALYENRIVLEEAVKRFQPANRR